MALHTMHRQSLGHAVSSKSLSARPSSLRSRRHIAAQASISPSQQPSYGVSLFDALRFNGPAPEVINGRLAMIGFMNAAFHEVAYSDTIIQQIQTELGPGTVALLLMWVVASLIPICKGVRNNEAFGPFSPQAEMINGRTAMLGIVLLAVLEDQAGVPFF